MIKSKQVEYQLLDFKRAAKNSAPLENEDKKNLAKTAGSFANAEGGVIVLGVECSKNEDKLDFASQLLAISKVEQFKTELDSCAPQLLQPYPNLCLASVT